MKYILFFILTLLPLCAAQKPLEKVSLQLQWLDQFQFAGYYMAKEKGFYKKAGFDVELKKFKAGLNQVDKVVSGVSTYAVGRSSLIKHYADGKKIVLLSAIFQSSPLILLALESSGIKSVNDFVGKKIMITPDELESASIHTMINLSEVDKHKLNFVKHTFDINDLVNKKIDLYGAYTSNEPYILKNMGIAYKIFSPKDFGFDFYSDILFTSQEQAKKNPKRVDDFKNASLEGWQYAFDNIEEAVDLIHEKYNPQKKSKQALMFEAMELKKATYVDNIELGNIDKVKIRRIYDAYKFMGLTKNNLNMQNMVFSYKDYVISKEERDYLDNKKEITVCVYESFLPYSEIQNGKLSGVSSKILDIANEYTKIPFKIISTPISSEHFECDILPFSTKQSELIGKNFNFTTAYHSEPLVIATKKQEEYIVDIDNELDKTFSIIKGMYFINELKSKYPKIKFHFVDSASDGLKSVEKGKSYGYIDDLVTVSYNLKHVSMRDLKISGQVEYRVDFSFAVRSDDEVLFNIFNKISKQLDHSDIYKIVHEWVHVHYTQKVNFKYIYESIFLVALLLFALFYRQQVLKNKNSELEVLKNELQSLNQTLESKVSDAVEEVQKKDAYLIHKSRLTQMGEVMSMISHQWKQPLSSISTTQISVLLALELESYDLDDKTQRDTFLKFLKIKLEKIGLYTQNLSQIISDFSDYYKPNKDAEVLHINRVIAKAYGIIEDSLNSRDIHVVLNLCSTKELSLHENEFMQVIVNILNNAREQFAKCSVENAEILINSYDEDDMVVLDISNNAGQIDENIIGQIFDPYFSTKLKENGTGLGLHMSKNIIEEHHNGSIKVVNTDDGVKFIIKIGTVQNG